MKELTCMALRDSKSGECVSSQIVSMKPSYPLAFGFGFFIQSSRASMSASVVTPRCIPFVEKTSFLNRTSSSSGIFRANFAIISLSPQVLLSIAKFLNSLHVSISTREDTQWQNPILKITTTTREGALVSNASKTHTIAQGRSSRCNPSTLSSANFVKPRRTQASSTSTPTREAHKQSARSACAIELPSPINNPASHKQGRKTIRSDQNPLFQKQHSRALRRFSFGRPEEYSRNAPVRSYTRGSV